VVSAGELGTEPSTLDQRLARILELAHMWDAVLLLDEADVFLQQRSGTDVNRHALTSIFLRQLEYYQGILILTTNMIDHFDVAFESACNYSFVYVKLAHYFTRPNPFLHTLSGSRLRVAQNDLEDVLC
jgi:hypothetical protein